MRINVFIVSLFLVCSLLPDIGFSQNKVVVIPLGADATGDATEAHVLKDKTFSNQNATGLTGTRPPAPVPKHSSGVGDYGIPWPDPRFTGNVTSGYIDHLTGLHWAMPYNTIMNRNLAWIYCDDLVILTGSGPYFTRLDDWRMPTIRELHSLIDFGQKNPALPDGQHFGNIENAPYWSSTGETDTTELWTVDMADGRLYSADWSTGSAFVWCVRGSISE